MLLMRSTIIIIIDRRKRSTGFIVQERELTVQMYYRKFNNGTSFQKRHVLLISKLIQLTVRLAAFKYARFRLISGNYEAKTAFQVQ